MKETETILKFKFVWRQDGYVSVKGEVFACVICCFKCVLNLECAVGFTCLRMFFVRVFTRNWNFNQQSILVICWTSGHVATKHREFSCKISTFWLLWRMVNDSMMIHVFSSRTFNTSDFFVRLQPWRVWYSSRVSARLPRWVLSGKGNWLRSLWRCFVFAGKKQLKVMI